MKELVELASIPNDGIPNIVTMYLRHINDPQVGDHNTIAKHAALMDQGTVRQLEEWAEQLSEENIDGRGFNHKPELAKKLGLPRKIIKTTDRFSSYNRNQNIRLMRFDFHPTTEGWAVSEVNSDAWGTCRSIGIA